MQLDKPASRTVHLGPSTLQWHARDSLNKNITEGILSQLKLL